MKFPKPEWRWTYFLSLAIHARIKNICVECDDEDVLKTCPECGQLKCEYCINHTDPCLFGRK